MHIRKTNSSEDIGGSRTSFGRSEYGPSDTLLAPLSVLPPVACATSQLLLGKLTEFVRNGVCDPKQSAAVSDCVPTKAIANCVDCPIGNP
jgi:hypothetical protein